jgi:large subunit ribosomal protein L6
MSKLARKPIILEKGVAATLKDGVIGVKGPKGELKVAIPQDVEVKLEEGKIFVSGDLEQKKAMIGLGWSLINNAVKGVTSGFSKKLEIVGKGWRATVKGNTIDFQLGYSHPVIVELPKEISASQENPGDITLSSCDKQLLGQICANIQKLRPVDPYKLKGIRIEGQYLRQKVRKAAGA